MTNTSRRHFLKLIAQSGGATAALSALPTSIANAFTIAPEGSSNSIQDVKHVVIFMQENRSFDHYFGCLKGVRGFGDPRPILTRGGKPVWQQPTEYGRFQLPFPLQAQASADFDRSQCMQSDLPHSWKYSQKMWAYYDVWVREKTTMSMGYLSRAELPFYYALADAFTVGDAYFASVFGPTDPNRMYLFSGTNGVSVGHDGRHALSNVDDGNETACMSRDKKEWKSPYLWTTYAERLSQHNVSWKVYQEYDNYGDNSLAYFPQFRHLDLSDPDQNERYQRARSYAGETSQLDAKGLPLNTNPADAQALVDLFARDVRSGNLPEVSWIVAPTKFCEHPEKNPPGYGESLSARLMDVLTEDPKVWAQTVFILCYDEEGGFFDHVPPPVAPATRADGYSTVSTDGEISGGEAYGLGARLPFLVASPWSRGGFVCSEVFDHTSIIRFLEKRFGVFEPNISAWRRAVCGDLTSMFDFSTPYQQRPQQLFNTPHQEYLRQAQQSCRGEKSLLPLNTVTMPQQELDSDNTRPARSLPYRLAVDGRITEDTGRFALQMRNMGSTAAVFTVYPSGHNSGPWYYTIGAQQSFTETWQFKDFANERYALRLHGPNGFLRVFQGLSKHQIEIEVEELSSNSIVNNQSQVLTLRIFNHGKQAQEVKLEDQFYGAPSQQLTIAAESSKLIYWSLENSVAWYDFKLSIVNDKDFLRRYAGHIEHAGINRSDPANGKLVFALPKAKAPEGEVK
ncbi:phosphocholine-specific phospholipase C [Undibacterium flavidum]|uniref:phospholipase C n=1 Tax=Undibacterium flavidum TaxID=2762297 RepID=A0ABR6YB85_9BURK|nr:phospholipase C, phosphocholine-specific [Undibacterium flavidum]MBC3873824.1 phospholipase C, phosphocholine-specific [Undibacterium flavidum]